MHAVSHQYTIKIKYFKASGKLYTSTKLTHPFQCSNIVSHSCYMNDVRDLVCKLRDNGELPGLGSGTWDDGYIYINCKSGYPCLILPRGDDYV